MYNKLLILPAKSRAVCTNASLSRT